MSLVSIITPAYNASKYIAETIESVLAQTYNNWELLIVDDGSTDNTAEVVKPYLGDNRISYFYQKNGKQGKARNLAISKSKGEYLAFLDADDLWIPEKLNLQLTAIKTNNIDLLFSQGWLFSETINSNLKEFNAPTGLQNANEFLSSMLMQNKVPILSVLVKKECVSRLGNFNENPKIQNAEDYQLWLRLLDNQCHFYGMEERLFYYRVHPNQSTNDFSATIIPKTWVLDSIVFKTVPQSKKIKLMQEKLDRTLFKYMDSWSDAKLKELVSLYRAPLSNFKKYIICRTSLLFGRNKFKIVWYRFYKTSE